MNKGLEALETLKHTTDLANPLYGWTNELNIIETELKRLENMDYHYLKVRDLDKKLKALEIIKEYPEQLLDIIDTDDYNEYLDLDYAPNQYLSEKNYYLLKEVLK